MIGTLWPGAERWTNSAIYLDPTGPRHWHEKVNLAYHERGVLHAGSRLPVLSVGIPRFHVRAFPASLAPPVLLPQPTSPGSIPISRPRLPGPLAFPGDLPGCAELIRQFEETFGR